MTKNLYVFIFLFLFIQCKPTSKEGEDQVFSHTATSAIKDNKSTDERVAIHFTEPQRIPLYRSKNTKEKLNSIIKNKRFIYLEDQPQSDIGEIHKVLFSANQIFVLDVRVSKAVFVFDITGKFMYRINEINNAFRPVDMAIVGDRLHVLDSKIAVLTYEVTSGKLLDKTMLPFFASSFAPDGIRKNGFNFLTYFNDEKNLFNKYWVINVDVSLDRLLHKDLRKNNIESLPITFFNMVNNGKETYFTKSFNDTIFKIVNDTIKPAICLDFNGKSIPESIKKEINKNHMKGLQTLMNNDYVGGAQNFMVTPHWYYLNYVTNKIKYNVYINRDSGKVIEFNSVIDTEFMGNLNLQPLGTNKEQFVYVIEGRKLKSRLASLNKARYKTTVQIQSIVKRLGSSNNPILVLANP